MKTFIFEIPDDFASLAPWLEKQLVGLDLHQLVLELEVLEAAALAEESDQELEEFKVTPLELEDELTEEIKLLDEQLGSKVSAVLEKGLGVLTEEELRRLLIHPRALLGLQEKVFLDGGEYWNSVPLSEEHKQMVENVERGFQEKLKAANLELPPGLATLPSPPSTGAGPSPAREQGNSPREGRGGGASAMKTLLSLAAAALVLVGGYFAYQSLTGPGKTVKQGWGFNQPGLMTAEMSPADYLKSLASAASTWKNQQQGTKEELQKRLTEFRKGCDNLINAPHPQLAAADRAWLIERCGAWAGKIDGHLADLQKGKSFETVKSEAQKTIDTLVEKLNERSQTAAALRS